MEELTLDGLHPNDRDHAVLLDGEFEDLNFCMERAILGYIPYEGMAAAGRHILQGSGPYPKHEQEVMDMMLEESIRILAMQEEILQFSHFTNEDAWELGSLMVAEAARNHLPVAISIRLNNGYTVFQYGFKGTNYNNEQWITRKHNTVRTMEMSSLRLFMLLKKNQETLESHGLNETEYVARGGGFPIRVAGAGVIGSVLVSGLDHMADHEFVSACMSQYLRIDGIPRLPVSF